MRNIVDHNESNKRELSSSTPIQTDVSTTIMSMYLMMEDTSIFEVQKGAMLDENILISEHCSIICIYGRRKKIIVCLLALHIISL